MGSYQNHDRYYRQGRLGEAGEKQLPLVQGTTRMDGATAAEARRLVAALLCALTALLRRLQLLVVSLSLVKCGEVDLNQVALQRARDFASECGGHFKWYDLYARQEHLRAEYPE